MYVSIGQINPDFWCLSLHLTAFFLQVPEYLSNKAKPSFPAADLGHSIILTGQNNM